MNADRVWNVHAAAPARSCSRRGVEERSRRSAARSSCHGCGSCRYTGLAPRRAASARSVRTTSGVRSCQLPSRASCTASTSSGRADAGQGPAVPQYATSSASASLVDANTMRPAARDALRQLRHLPRVVGGTSRQRAGSDRARSADRRARVDTRGRACGSVDGQRRRRRQPAASGAPSARSRTVSRAKDRSTRSPWRPASVEHLAQAGQALRPHAPAAGSNSVSAPGWPPHCRSAAHRHQFGKIRTPSRPCRRRKAKSVVERRIGGPERVEVGHQERGTGDGRRP